MMYRGNLVKKSVETAMQYFQRIYERGKSELTPPKRKGKKKKKKKKKKISSPKRKHLTPAQKKRKRYVIFALIRLSEIHEKIDMEKSREYLLESRKFGNVSYRRRVVELDKRMRAKQIQNAKVFKPKLRLDYLLEKVDKASKAATKVKKRSPKPNRMGLSLVVPPPTPDRIEDHMEPATPLTPKLMLDLTRHFLKEDEKFDIFQIKSPIAPVIPTSKMFT